MRGHVRIIVGLMVGAVLLWAGPAGAQQNPQLKPLRIVTFRVDADVGIRFSMKVQKEAYRRLGYSVSFLIVPGKRASAMGASGEVDGELARNGEYGDFCPNLVRVDEPFAVLELLAYTTDPELVLDGWESLRGTSLRAEYLRGLTACEGGLQGVLPPALISQVDSVEQGLKRLMVNRIDIFIGTRIGVEKTWEKETVQAFALTHGQSGRLRVAGVMQQIRLYAWLNPKHADLAPRLAATLREMKQDGTFERFVREVGSSREELPW